jgi:hypothetical protein
MSGLIASSVPDKPPPNNLLISIMNQLDFRSKRILDAATRKPDFGNN